MKGENFQQMTGAFSQIRTPKDLWVDVRLGGIQKAIRPLRERNVAKTLAKKFQSPMQKVLDQNPAFQMAKKITYFPSPVANFQNDYLHKIIKENQKKFSSLHALHDTAKILSQEMGPTVNPVYVTNTKFGVYAKEVNGIFEPLIEAQKKTAADMQPLVTQLSKLGFFHNKHDFGFISDYFESLGYFKEDIDETVNNYSEEIAELSEATAKYYKGGSSLSGIEDLRIQILKYVNSELTKKQFAILYFIFSIIGFVHSNFVKYPNLIDFTLDNGSTYSSMEIEQQQEQIDSLEKRNLKLERKVSERNCKILQQKIKIDTLDENLKINKSDN